jgi:hypothetical protein
MIFFLSILKKSGVDPLVQSLEHYPELVQVKKKKEKKDWFGPIQSKLGVTVT